MPVFVRSSGHTIAAVRALLRVGFRFERVPAGGRLARNGQLMRIRWRTNEKRLRIFIYKITGSGRNTHERRIEITTTYQKGLARAAGYSDIVLGYDPEDDVYVGVDARRMAHGGPTGNASSFVNPEGLGKATNSTLMILRRPSQIFGVEYQAYFRAHRLAEYLANTDDVHRGLYDNVGEFSANGPVGGPQSLQVSNNTSVGAEVILVGPASKRKKQQLRKKVLIAFEEDDTAKLKDLRLTQDQLLRLNRIRQEIGLRGEEIVYRSEVRRLNRAGKKALAARISWVSQTRPFEGYDILSFETDGGRRFIEVKATKGQGRVFPITDNEWRLAAAMRARYYIYRVTEVEGRPKIRIFRDPVRQEEAGVLKRDPLAWTIKYQ